MLLMFSKDTAYTYSSLCMLSIFAVSIEKKKCHLLIFFQNNFLKKCFRNTSKVSNSLGPNQALHFVRPNLSKVYQQTIKTAG